jgi:hypothetical protein
MDPSTTQQWLDALRWVMTAPGLITELPGGHTPLLSEDDPRLHKLLERTTADFSDLKRLIDGRRSYKVGPAFEALIQYGLTHGLGHECLAFDLQVYDEKRTMGALDLVLRSHDGQIAHWELAYKLYLQSGDALEWKHWIGPNERDRLNRKVARLLDHQLPLSKRPQAQSALATIGVEHIDTRRILLLGALFSHWDAQPSRAVRASSPAQGRWAHERDMIDVVIRHSDALWSHRPKPHWFGPWNHVDIPLSGGELLDQMRAQTLKRPELWVMSEANARPFFIVPNHWGQGRRS